MTLRKQNFSLTLLLGLTVAATAGVARAQNTSDNGASPASPRSEWEQRVVSHPADSSDRVGAQPNAATLDYSLNGTPRPRGVWLPAHPIAASVEVGDPGAVASPAPSRAPAPVPVTTPSVAPGNSPFDASSGDIQYPSPGTTAGRGSVGPLPSDPAYGTGSSAPPATNAGPGGQPIDDPDGGPGGAVSGDGSCCDCDGAASCLGCGGCRRALSDFSLFAGGEGLSAVVPGQGAESGIGFREGFNWGGPVGGTIAGDNWREIGFQLGFAADQFNIQSNAAGISGELSEIFVTGGLFHRAMNGGLQWGLVFDYAHDSFLLTEDLRQLRYEISFVNPCCGEFGLWGTASIGATQQLRATDLYALFYRRYFSGGGNGRVFGGITEDGSGIVGVDLQIPLGRSWALQNGAGVLFPSNATANGGNLQQSWSLGIQLVWYPGRCAACQLNSQFSPLQPVADNMYLVPRAN
jgi:hypothetical protein